MVTPILLGVLLFLCDPNSASTIVGSYPSGQTSVEFNQLAIDNATGTVYIGAVNTLFRLDGDLQLLQNFSTGPVTDSPYCSPPPSSCSQGTSTDNYNKILVVDNSGNKLITCGSVFQGTCESRPLTDLSQVTPHRRSDPLENYIAANSPDATTVAFVAPGLNSQNALYVASTYTGNWESGRLREQVTAVSTRSLQTLELEIYNALTAAGTYMYFSDTSRNSYPVNYTSGFSLNGYSYFATNQKTTLSSTEYETRLIRICQNDDRYYSYFEMPLRCSDFNLANSISVARLGRDDVLLLGVFRRGSDSALCVFSMDSIKLVIKEKYEQCYAGNGNTEARQFTGGSRQCISIPSYNYGSSYCNQDYGGANTPLVATTAVTTSPALTTSSSTWITVETLTTTSYTVALVGTADGQLKKILVQSNTSAVEYASVQVSNDEVKQIKLDRTAEHMFVMTKYKISKIKIEDCGSYISCDECLASRDPFCGWCSLENKCSRKSQCSGADGTDRWLPFDNGQCININSISPSNTPIARPTQVNISVSLLPPGQTYQCVFDTTAVSASVTGGDTVTCDIPTSLPTIPNGKDHVTISLSMKSVTTGVRFLRTNFTYFDCGAHSRCVSCTSSSWACDWCIHANKCTHASSTCSPSGDVIPGANSHASVAVKGPTFCPQLLQRSGDVLLPAGVSNTISLPAKNLPVPQSGQSGYQCKIGSNIVPATQQSASTILCQSHAYAYSAERGQERHEIQVVWNGNHVIDQPPTSQVSATLYKCNIMGSTCGTCIGSFESRFGCAFCGGVCKYQPTCNVPADTTCPDVIINWVSPLSAPVEGHTKVSINGTNLGTSGASIPTVRLAGVTCSPVVEEYVVSKRIVCKAAESPGRLPRNGSITVQVQSLDRVYNYSKQFRYLNPILEGLFPMKGPKSGGSSLTIRGRDLDAGVLDNISMSLGEELLPCITDRSSITSHSVVCTTVAVSAPKTVSSVRMSFDGSARMLAQSPFKYTEDPVINAINPLVSFASGGRNLTVSGRYLDSVQSPKMFIWDAGDKTQITDCFHEPETSGTTVICPSPRAPSNVKTILPNSMNISMNSMQSTSMDKYEVGFIMDGVMSSQTLTNVTSTLGYVPDPVFYNLTKDESEKIFQNGTSLILRGESLNLAASASDFTVLVGGQKCNVTALALTAIVCSPPWHWYGDKLVKIHIGNLEYHVGHLRYGDPPTPHNENYAWLAGVFVPIIAVACVVIIALIIVYRRKRTKQIERRDGDYLGLDMATSPRAMISTIEDALSLIKDGDLKAALKPLLLRRERIKMGKLLGTGHFGCVFEAIYEDSEQYNPSKVAVKTFQGKCADIQNLNNFLKEAALMASFRHNHVMTLLGICFDVDGNPMIVLPYMANGDLKSYIESPKNEPTGLQLLQFGLDIARGMEYLADNKCVHRDLAARNCMLDDRLQAKVADFGLSRDVYTSEYYSSQDKDAKLPVKWMAPESMERNVYTVQSDVWSYGILLWELFTRGKVPYPGVDGWDVIRFLKLGKRLEKPDYCPQQVYQLMLRCWEWLPEERPDFKSIVTEVTGIIDANTESAAGSSGNPTEQEENEDHTYTEITAYQQ